jgi:enoyl-CoA hydratase/carnithine racemase
VTQNSSSHSEFEAYATHNCFVVRFLRSEYKNPLSTNVVSGLISLLDNFDQNLPRKFIFTGRNDVFAAGADLKEIARLDRESARDFAMRGQTLMNKISSLPILTMAAVNGYCFGGGLDLALACDQRIASPNAVFSHPGVGLGIITGWGGTQRLPRLIGEANALEMLLTGARFDADWALRVGLIDKIVDDPLNYALNEVD